MSDHGPANNVESTQKNGVLSGFSWLFFSQIGRIASQLLGVSIIARLLTPADFGVIAIALMASNLAGLLRDMGTGPAAIRSPDGSKQFLGGIYSVQLVISLALAGALLLAARPLADFYRTEVLARVLCIFSVVFPLSALGGTHLIVLERAQRYRDISAIEVLSYIGGLLAAIWLARAGVGVESLAVQAVTNAGIQTLLQRLASGTTLRPRHPRHARSAAGGSMAVTSFQLMNYVVRNSDTAIAGRLATANFLGTYSMAGRIAQMPTQLIGMLVSRVSIPTLSAEGPDATTLARKAERLIAGSLLASTAVCLGLLAMRQTITTVLFGHQWLASVPPQLVWLLPAAALTSTTAVVIGVMTAFGATASLTRTGVFSAIAHISVLLGCLSVNVQWLPVAILLSAFIALTLSALHLRAVQENLGMPPLRLSILIPATALLLVFAIWQDTLLLPGPTTEPVRSPAKELLEGFGIVVLLLVVTARQWRSWRIPSLEDQQSVSPQESA